MFPFDVVLFDVGGVLLTNGWDRCERKAVLDRFQVDRVAFEALHATAYDAWERGATDARAYLDATVFTQPRNFSQDEFLEAILAESQLLADSALGTLKELAASNRCLLGALNNEAREPNQYRFAQFGLGAYFHVAFSSCYLGLRKPEPAIFCRVLDMLGKPGDRVLFIDDRAENVLAAGDAGIKAMQYAGETALRRDLEALGVL
jgi:putative hydrolase of the HAD superfamily